LELCVTQAAVSHQVKALEKRLGVPLFRRTSRGLLLTDEGAALQPTLTEVFDRLTRVLTQFEGGRLQEVLTVSVVGTFAVGWLLPRLPQFQARHPFVDLRLLTNNNKVDLAGESLDYAVRFGDGAWQGVEAEKLVAPPFTPLCAPQVASRLERPADLAAMLLLRSYRVDDWPTWFRAAGVERLTARGPLFDSAWMMVQVAMQTESVALAPPAMFGDEMAAGRIVRPFPQEVDLGSYWLTRLLTRPRTPAMSAFRDWLLAEAAGFARAPGPAG
jgi:LysR family transcriptional regulator of beta-lactamase